MKTVAGESSKTQKVLVSFIGMFVVGIGIIALAIITASFLNSWFPLPGYAIKVFEYLGYLGWSATLGARGWDIQTLNGTTFPERLNGWLIQIFSIIGIFSFVLARELVPAA